MQTIVELVAALFTLTVLLSLIGGFQARSFARSIEGGDDSDLWFLLSKAPKGLMLPLLTVLPTVLVLYRMVHSGRFDDVVWWGIQVGSLLDSVLFALGASLVVNLVTPFHLAFGLWAKMRQHRRARN